MSELLSTYLSEDHFVNAKYFTLSFLIWNTMNLIVMNLNLPDKHMKREDMLDMRNRLTSLVHGTTSLFMAGYSTYFIRSQCGEHNNKFEEFLLIFSAGYFAYDLLVMAYFRILDMTMTIHHSICITGMTIALITGNSGDVLIACLMHTEISNPAMHIRMVLKHLGKRYTKAYETSEVTYMSKYHL